MFENLDKEMFDTNKKDIKENQIRNNIQKILIILIILM